MQAYSNTAAWAAYVQYMQQAAAEDSEYWAERDSASACALGEDADPRWVDYYNSYLLAQAGDSNVQQLVCAAYEVPADEADATNVYGLLRNDFDALWEGQWEDNGVLRMGWRNEAYFD